MSWIVTIVIAGILYWYFIKIVINSNSTREGGSSSNANSSFEVTVSDLCERVSNSKNIYSKVEQFAALGRTCKAQTNWAYDSLDFASINIQRSVYGVEIRMTYRGDCAAIWVKAQNGFEPDGSNQIRYVGVVHDSFESVDEDELFDAFQRGEQHAILEQCERRTDSIWINIKFC